MEDIQYSFPDEFDIDETPLTKFISCEDFKAAEQIIEATVDPTFLNDGHYLSMPLFMVLTNDPNTEHCRNLKLARLLVQKGVSPNVEIPFRYTKRASPSPFQELVVYYEMLRAYAAGDFNSQWLNEELDMSIDIDELEFLTNTVDLDNVKCLPNLEDIHKLIEQTSELIDVFLCYGSDPSVFMTTVEHKPLFLWVVELEDVALAKRFLGTCRVDLTVKDIHGTDPLMRSILKLKPENALALYETMCETMLETAEDVVDINISDCCGETALSKAAFVGATELVKRLCKDGAKLRICVGLEPSTKFSACLETNVTDKNWNLESLFNEPGYPFLTTPLLASLLANSPVRHRYEQVLTQSHFFPVFKPHKHLTDKIVLASVSPLIDMGCLSNQTVAVEIMYYLRYTSFQYLQTVDINPTDLLTLMFGQVSAGLRQLCVRTIFDCCVMSSQGTEKTWLKTEPHVFCLSQCCKKGMSTEKIKELIEMLGLPLSLQIFFDIEAAKYQICGTISSHERRYCNCEDSYLPQLGPFERDEDDELYQGWPF